MRLRELIIYCSSMCKSRDLRTFPDILFKVPNLVFFYKDSSVSLLQIDTYMHAKKFLQHLSKLFKFGNIIVS